MKRLSLSTPHLLVMVGTPGAGKSFFARQFAKTFMAPMVSFDTIRVVVSGDKPTYDKSEQQVVSTLASEQLNQLLQTKSTIIVDGGAESRGDRLALMKIGRSHGYSTLFIWVQTDPATSKKRAVNGIKGQTRRQDLLTSEQYEALVSRFSVPHPSEPTVVISGKHTYATQAKVILKKLTESRTSAVEGHQPMTERPEPTQRSFNRIKIT